MQCLAEKDRAQLVHPRDRNGRSLPERYASGELEDALDAFRSACAAATAAVRERLRQLRLHALEAAAAQLSALGSYGLALDAALTALRADPLRESAHRAVIRVHLAEGNVAEARRAFRQCRLLLRRELHVEPSPQTARMVQASPGAVAPVPPLAPARRDAGVTVR